MSLGLPDPILLLVGLAAAVVNGAVGYGFSTLFTPVALLYVTNRVLNPALVMAELVMNGYLIFHERAFIRQTWRRAIPMIVGLIPGVAFGSLALLVMPSNAVKVAFYVLLLPLVLLQFIGFRRPLTGERHAGTTIGMGVGFLYSLTTISGPPLALFWRNQGLVKDEFRCTIAQVRLAETGFTASAYLILGLLSPPGLFTTAALTLSLTPLLAILIGIPIGVSALWWISKEFFGRLAMGMDIILVVYGLSKVLSIESISLISGETALYVLLITILAVVAAGILMLRNMPLTTRDEEALVPAICGSAGR